MTFSGNSPAALRRPARCHRRCSYTPASRPVLPPPSAVQTVRRYSGRDEVGAVRQSATVMPGGVGDQRPFAPPGLVDPDRADVAGARLNGSNASRVCCRLCLAQVAIYRPGAALASRIRLPTPSFSSGAWPSAVDDERTGDAHGSPGVSTVRPGAPGRARRARSPLLTVMGSTWVKTKSGSKPASVAAYAAIARPHPPDPPALRLFRSSQGDDLQRNAGSVRRQSAGSSAVLADSQYSVAGRRQSQRCVLGQVILPRVVPAPAWRPWPITL